MGLDVEVTKDAQQFDSPHGALLQVYSSED